MTATRGQDVIVATAEDVSRRSVIISMGLGALATVFAARGWSVTARAQDATPMGSMQPMEELNAVVVLYNQPEDPAAFQDQLMNQYLPMVYEIPDIRDYIVHSGLVTREGTPGDVYQIGTFVWDSQADMEAALMSETGMAAVAETATIATGGFAAYFAHVDFLSPPSMPGSPDASPPA